MLPTPTFLHPSISKITGQSENRLDDAIHQIECIVNHLDIPVAIVGGLAGIHHGTGVTTLDIDLVVRSQDCDRFADALIDNGFVLLNRSANRWHQLQTNDQAALRVEFLPSGEKTPRDSAEVPGIPDPTELGVDSGLAYANLAGWVKMKMLAGRDKDYYHLHELAKKLSEPEIASIVVQLRELPETYTAKFHRILDQAQQDDRSDW